ncbi:MAG: ABC transporter ATP-binding protein [Alphaproteobacteria bacterium]
MTAPALALAGVGVARAGALVVEGIDLTIAAGEIVALFGANGAGKSTLIAACMGLVPVAAGRIAVAGTDVTALPAEARARRGIGWLPEGRRVFPGLTVRENIEVAVNGGRTARARALERGFALFPALAPRARERAWRLSGGQQQMLALARALASQPRILLADEPSLGLAPALADAVFEALPGVARDGTAILLAEQDRARARRVADRAVALVDGRLAAA